MKEAPIIPLLPLGNSSFPFKIETIHDVCINGDEMQSTYHNHNYYEMIWMTKGACNLYTDLHQFQIENGSIFCIRPNQAHGFDINPEMEGFVFSFTESFFNGAEQEFDWTSDTNVIQILSPESRVRTNSFSMKEIVSFMMKEYESQFELRINVLRRYFSIFLLYVLREIEDPSKVIQQSRESNLVKTFMKMLDQNFKEKKMVADYAQTLCVTPNYLNRVLKKDTGFTARQHIKKRIILEAKRLSRYSNAGMKQIAYNLGFYDSSHFSKFFKAAAGTNFTDFKNLNDVATMPTYFHRA